MELAGNENRNGAGIQIERDDQHQFRRGSATMVGRRITLRRGVRALTIECGWPRTPQDGIVRGGGLACANVKHFGRPRLNEELLLISPSKGSPRWVTQKEKVQSPITKSDLHRHLSLLVQS